MEKGQATERQSVKIPPEELAIELMTSSQRLTGGRDEARRLLRSLYVQWGKQIANRQRNAHDEAWPSYHSGQPCQPSFECHVSKVIELAEAGE